MKTHDELTIEYFESFLGMEECYIRDALECKLGFSISSILPKLIRMLVRMLRMS
jgi:hypothetical protein